MGCEDKKYLSIIILIDLNHYARKLYSVVNKTT